MASTFFILKTAPAEVRSASIGERLRYYALVVEYGLRRKDWELARGLNARGEPLPPVRPATREHRRSAMTPTGKGDPSAPYLMPGRKLSRTRSLLTGKPHADYAEFGWRFDAHVGDQWGRILAIHARRGKEYDVVGLSPKGKAWVAARAIAAWRQGESIPTPKQPAEPVEVKVVGWTDLDHSTGGIGGTLAEAKQAIAEGRSSGFLTKSEWDKHFRSPAPAIAARPGVAASVRKGKSNVLLQHVWGGGQSPPRTPAGHAASPTPGPKPRPAGAKAAMKPEPEPRPLAKPKRRRKPWQEKIVGPFDLSPPSTRGRSLVRDMTPEQAVEHARRIEFENEAAARAWAESVYGGRWSGYYEESYSLQVKGEADKAAGTDRWWVMMTRRERDDIKDYTGNAYAQLNARLRSGDPIDPNSHFDQAFVNYTKSLDKSMGMAAPTPRDVVLYRGVGHPEGVLKALGLNSVDDIQPGMTFSDRAFTSTTISKAYAEELAVEHPGEVLKFKILVPAGTDGYFIGDNSTLPNEKEFLLGRALDTFEVVGRDGDWIVLRASRSDGG